MRFDPSSLVRPFVVAVAFATAAQAQTNCVSQAFPVPLAPPVLSPLAEYGKSIALNSLTMVVGAPGHDGQRGAVLVHRFDFATGSFDSGIMLQPPVALNPYDRFGEAVAFNGTFIFVGAPGRDDGAFESGMVWIYKQETIAGVIQYSYQGNLFPALALTGGHYGNSLAVSAGRLVVGVPGASATYPQQGAIAIITPHDPQFWLNGYNFQLRYASNPQANEHFGTSVAIDGSTVVAGGPQYDLDASTKDSGRAIVFNPDAGGSWQQTTEFKFFTATADRLLGASVAVSGTRMVFGAPGMLTAPNQRNGGAIVLKKLAGPNGWVFDTELKPTAGAAGLGHGYGRGVSMSSSRICLGADDAAVEFKILGGGWTEWHDLEAPYSKLDSSQPIVLGPSVASNDAFTLVARPAENSGIGHLYPFWACGGSISYLGGGTTGSNGPPRLGYAGPLVTDMPVEFSLIHGKPFAPAILLVRAGQAGNFPFKGGNLMALPFQLSLTLPLNALGEIHVPSILPTGLGGQYLTLQALVVDSQGQGGVALTNAVQLQMAP